MKELLEHLREILVIFGVILVGTALGLFVLAVIINYFVL